MVLHRDMFRPGNAVLDRNAAAVTIVKLGMICCVYHRPGDAVCHSKWEVELILVMPFVMEKVSSCPLGAIFELIPTKFIVRADFLC